MAENEHDKNIDENWKQKVANEKQQADQQEPPPASIVVLVSGLTSQALIGIGELPNPISGKRERNLDEAKFSIDMLQVLQDKTKGNLTDEEKRYLDTVLYDLRMRFIATR